MGLFENHTYCQNELPDLSAGTVIALGTDGIWEAHAKNGEMFGKDRFRKIIETNKKGTGYTFQLTFGFVWKCLEIFDLDGHNLGTLRFGQNSDIFFLVSKSSR